MRKMVNTLAVRPHPAFGHPLPEGEGHSARALLPLGEGGAKRRMRARTTYVIFAFLALLAACTRSPHKQLVVVTTADWKAVDGTMRLYENEGGRWKKVGADVPVVVGRTGMAWGKGERAVSAPGPI